VSTLPIANRPLPLAATAAHSGGSEDEARQGWQREMERAQMEAWLSHGVIGHAAQPALQPQPQPWVGPALALEVTGTAAPAPIPGSAGAAAHASLRDRTPAVFERLAPGQTARSSASQILNGNAAGRAEGRAVTSSSMPQTQNVDRPASLFAQDPQRPAVRAVAGQAPSGPDAGAERDGRFVEAFVAQLTAALKGFAPVQVTTGPVVPNSTGIPFAPTGSAPAPAGSHPAVGLQPHPHDAAGGPAIAVPAGMSGTASASMAERRHPRASAVPRASPLAATPTRSRDLRSAEQSPIRVHADWSAEGVRLWLGIDAGALDSLHPVAEQLRRWLAGQGHRLLALHCNGRLLAQLPRSSSSSPPVLFVKEVP
jgi:hypothetical protein